MIIETRNLHHGISTLHSNVMKIMIRKFDWGSTKLYKKFSASKVDFVEVNVFGRIILKSINRFPLDNYTTSPYCCFKVK